MSGSSDDDASWNVYILRCCDNSLYTGITNNLRRRLAEHNGESGNGARYTRSRRPVSIVYSEPAADRQQASQREATLKALSKTAKETLVVKALNKNQTNIQSKAQRKAHSRAR